MGSSECVDTVGPEVDVVVVFAAKQIVFWRALRTAVQIGMHHIALDRAGPDDRHLDDEIVDIPRPQPRQHCWER
ncbi:MAG: hypothetical protein WBX25_33165 [Rhodomicrobium sp.]